MSKSIFILFIIYLSVAQAKSLQKTIYGRDDRSLYADSHIENFKTLARATAARIHTAYFKEETELSFITYGWNLETSVKLCKDERFSQKFGSASCTGFLVAKDLILTAGHCVPNEFVCKDVKWVFDYRDDLIEEVGEDEIAIKKKNIFSCQKILKLRSDGEQDWALIKLDRPTQNRPVFKLTKRKKISKKTRTLVVGYPLGMPLTITPNGRVRVNNNKHFFKVNNDTFGGNSGSPVINQYTGKVEGILISGDADFEESDNTDCRYLKRCGENNCKGEKVQRIQDVLKSIGKYLK